MKLAFAITMLLLTAPALAGGPETFTGRWSGKGTYIYNGVMSQCREFSMTFEGTRESFEFVTGSRKCDNHEEEFANVKMEARGGELFFYGQKVGTYSENGQLTAAYSLPEGNGHTRHWRMNMQRRGDHLMYEESRTMDEESTPLISFAGLMMLEK